MFVLDNLVLLSVLSTQFRRLWSLKPDFHNWRSRASECAKDEVSFYSCMGVVAAWNEQPSISVNEVTAFLLLPAAYVRWQ